MADLTTNQMRFLLSIGVVLLSLSIHAQRFKSVTSSVHFYSSAVLEDIEALNSKASSAIDLSTGDMVFSVPVNQFEFDKSLMKEHFNENYLESEEFPKIIFKAKLSNMDLVEGDNQVKALGELDLHGVKRRIEVPGTLNFSGDEISLNAKFQVKLEDYKIKIPRLLFQSIAEEIEITVEFIYEPI